MRTGWLVLAPLLLWGCGKPVCPGNYCTSILGVSYSSQVVGPYSVEVTFGAVVFAADCPRELSNKLALEATDIGCSDSFVIVQGRRVDDSALKVSVAVKTPEAYVRRQITTTKDDNPCGCNLYAGRFELPDGGS